MRFLLEIVLPCALLLGGGFYTVWLRGFAFFHPLRTAKLCFAEKKSGQTSSLSALSLALAGTLGVGNIVGVADALRYGGAGSLFWMCVAALLAMSLKYAEVVLALVYKKGNRGGAPYYMREFGKEKRWGIFGLILPSAFCVFCLADALSMGCAIQSEAAVKAIGYHSRLSPLLIGGVLATLTWIGIRRGKKKVLSLTDKLVPLMTVAFCVLSLAAIFKKREEIPRVTVEIFSSAFSVSSGAAGGGYGLFLLSLRYGCSRGLLSNEAGCGSSPFAHAQADCPNPARQGVFGMIEVLVDTVFLCPLSGFVLLLFGNPLDGSDPMTAVLTAYENALGKPASLLPAVAVVLFAFATFLCWSGYGAECLRFLLKNDKGEELFYFVFSLSVFLSSVIRSRLIWDTADIAGAVMTVINLFYLIMMRGKVREQTVNAGLIKKAYPKG